MIPTQRAILRRSFLKAVTPCLGVAFCGSIPAPIAWTIKSQVPAERGRFSEKDLGWVRSELLKLANGERAAAGLIELQLDELACRVANDHAADMIRGNFLSHWGSDGLKPYQRYAFAGGIDAVQENVSEATDIASITPMRVFSDLEFMHKKMYSEKPPNDGHRRTILTPQNTHAGFGIVLQENSLRLTELYLARYLELSPFPQTAKPKATVKLKGKLLDSKNSLYAVSVFHEPLPSPPELAWLRTPRPYSYPDEYIGLRPKAPYPATYTDGSRGDFDSDSSGRFTVPVNLSKSTPGIYTVLFLIKRASQDKSFPGAQVCIRAE